MVIVNSDGDSSDGDSSDGDSSEGDSSDGDSTIDGVYYLGLAASFPPSNLVPNCPNGCSKFTLLLPT